MAVNFTPCVVEIGPGMPARLAAFCRERGTSRVRMVADANTWAALGQAARETLRSSSIDVGLTLFESGVQADEAALERLRADDDGRGRVMVAVGSGTITDLVRYHTARRNEEFISMPTAASVDAYSSAVSALMEGGAKLTRPARPPVAIFADLDVLAAAPAPMTAAGFGDLVCKFSALADWRLGALAWEEPWDGPVASRMRAAAEACSTAAQAIGRRDIEGIAILMRGLLESGSAMATTGHSRPASGAEHHYSHYWEMYLHAEGRPPILHGLKVGVATVITAGLWEGLRGIGRASLEERLASAVLPRRATLEAQIKSDYGARADAVVAAQSRFLSLDNQGFESVKQKIRDNWDEISALAASVPGPAETAALLKAAGCPTRPEELGLEPHMIAAAGRSAHWLRDRFTIRKLVDILCLAPVPCDPLIP